MIDVLSMTPEEAREEARRRDERRAKGLPLTPDVSEPEEQARIKEADDRLEKIIQRDVWKLYRRFNCQCYWMSQARKTRQTAGVPDLIVFNRRARAMWYHEIKTPTGEQSPAQKVFQEQCNACAIYYALGGVAAAEDVLITIGVAYRLSDGSLEPRH
jgi:hypothetical protein